MVKLGFSEDRESVTASTDQQTLDILLIEIEGKRHGP